MSSDNGYRVEYRIQPGSRDSSQEPVEDASYQGHIKTEPMEDYYCQMPEFDLEENAIHEPVTEETPAPELELTAPQMELLCLLKWINMEDLFPIFKREDITKAHLKTMNVPTLLALLQPHVRIRRIIDFQEKIKNWKKEPTETKSVATQANLKHTKFDLSVLLSKTAAGRDLLQQPVLNVGQRHLLIECIVNFFVRYNIALTHEIRESIGEQIVQHFPKETIHFYVDSSLSFGLESDMIYNQLRNVKRKAQYSTIKPKPIVNSPAQPIIYPNTPKVNQTVTGQRILYTISSAGKVVKSLTQNSSGQVDAFHTVIPTNTPINSRGGPKVIYRQIPQAKPLKSTDVSRASPVMAQQPKTPVMFQYQPVSKPQQTVRISPVGIPNQKRIFLTNTAAKVFRATVATTVAPEKTVTPAVAPPTTIPADTVESFMLPDLTPKLEGTVLAQRSSPMVIQRRIMEKRAAEALRGPPEKVQIMEERDPLELPMNDDVGQDLLQAVKGEVEAEEDTEFQGEIAEHAIHLVEAEEDEKELDPPQEDKKKESGEQAQDVDADSSTSTISCVTESNAAEVSNTAAKVVTPPTEASPPPKEQSQSKDANVAETIENTPKVGSSQTVMEYSKKPSVRFLQSKGFIGQRSQEGVSINMEVLSLGFEQKHDILNRFRNRAWCENFVEKMEDLLQNDPRFKLNWLNKDQPLKKRMAPALFLLPAALRPDLNFTLRSKMITNFISVCPSVQLFINSVPNTTGPFVAIIGSLQAPESYAVFCQKKVYRCGEMWHSIDIAIKIFMLYNLQMTADAATAWQFIMMHFYDMRKHMAKVFSSVIALHSKIRKDVGVPVK